MPRASLAMVLAALLMAGASGLLRAQRPTPQEIPPGTNVVFGRVVDTGADRPLAGAVVTLTGYFETSGWPAERMPRSSMDPRASVPRHVLTNAAGYFFFRALPAGRYSLATAAFGYVNDAFPLRIVELADREAPTEVTLRLWKTGAISGRVVDEQGDPVVGAPVAALEAITTAAGVILRGVAATAESDDRGEFRIAHLHPGPYAVAVLSTSLSVPASLAADVDASASNRAESSALRSALIRGGGRILDGGGQRVGNSVLQRPGPPPILSPDGQLLTYATTFHPGTASPADAVVVTLRSGEARAGIDIPIRFAPTVEVSGVVVSPDGPMSGFTLHLQPAGAAAGWTDSFEPVGIPRAVTDSNGAFRFLAVVPGSYVLGGAYLEEARPDLGRENVTLRAWVPIVVGDGGASGLTVTLSSGARVHGRVEFRGATESPLTPDAGVGILLRPAEAMSWRALPGGANPDGTFTTAGDAPGRYIVTAAFYPEGWALESVSRGGTVLRDDVIELDSADVRDLVITFSSTPTRLSGAITRVDGAPDAGADVIVFPADSAFWREGIPNYRRARLVHATSTGTFELSGLAPGDYHIVAVNGRDAFAWEDPAFLESLIPAATTFTLTASRELTVSLQTITLRGR